jgi:hypothetical protein
MKTKEKLPNVRILKSSPADRADTRTETTGRNRYAVDNVNQAQGPRVGNEGAHKAKRGNFLDSKEERAPIADQIMAAFAKRDADLEANPGEHEMPESGSIRATVPVQRFAARKNKYKD